MVVCSSCARQSCAVTTRKRTPERNVADGLSISTVAQSFYCQATCANGDFSVNAIDMNGVRIAYDIEGNGPPVLLICGTGQPAASWNFFVHPALGQAGFQTIAFDNRGMPPSGCPEPPWTVADMAGDAIGLIEALHLGPCHILGASLGAMIAQSVALLRPDLVRSAVLHVGGGNASLHSALELRGYVKLLERGCDIPQEIWDLAVINAVLTPTQVGDDALVRATQELVHGLTGFGPGGRLGQYTADAQWFEEDHLEGLTQMQPPWSVHRRRTRSQLYAGLGAGRCAQAPKGEYLELPNCAHATTDPQTA